MLVLLLPLGSSEAALRMACHDRAPASAALAQPSHCAKHKQNAPADGAHCRCYPGCMGASLPTGAIFAGASQPSLPDSAQPASSHARAELPAPYRPPIAALFS